MPKDLEDKLAKNGAALVGDEDEEDEDEEEDEDYNPEKDNECGGECLCASVVVVDLPISTF